jgi:hypothetical protein
MKRHLLLLSLLVCLFSNAFCQSKDLLRDDSLLKNELERTVYTIDSNAKAVILYEDGILNFNYGSYSYTYEIIAKVLSSEDIADLTEIIIPKRENTDITSISAETYNLVNGEIKKNKLEKENILKDQIDKDLNIVKFSIPNVQKGAIIHYTYKLYKDAPIAIPEWTFQNLYPTLISKYKVIMPSAISFNRILRTRKQFKEVKRESDLETCDACEYSKAFSTETVSAWSTSNIPAFQKEPFSSSEDNFRERVKVLITSYYSGNGSKVKMFNNWDDFSKKYLYNNNEYLGQVFKANAFLDDIVVEITKNSASDIEKAQAIFAYVRSHFLMVEKDDQNIKSVFRNQKGNVYGINMLLVAMMKNAKLDCDPVVLSTKSNERLTALYPSPFGLDYLIGYFKDKDKGYFLDATNPNLPFGTLMPECYNGYARIVNKEGEAIELSPDNIKDKTATIVSISPSENKTTLQVKIDQKLGVFSSMEVRNEAKGYIEDAIKSMTGALVGNAVTIIPAATSLKNFDNPEQPLAIHIEGTMSLGTNLSLMYFNPYLFKFYSKNPFTAVDRNLPIEMDYKEDCTYLLNLKLPEGFSFDDFPKSTNLRLGEGGQMLFSNIFDYNEETQTMNVSSKFQTATTIFPASEYISVRTFYERMIEEQNKKIILKKN